MKEVLFSIGNEKAFLVATLSSSIWSRPDLEMQFQTRSIVPNYFERSLPALTRCQYLLLFLLTLKQKLELKLWTAEASIFLFLCQFLSTKKRDLEIIGGGGHSGQRWP